MINRPKLFPFVSSSKTRQYNKGPHAARGPRVGHPCPKPYSNPYSNPTTNPYRNPMAPVFSSYDQYIVEKNKLDIFCCLSRKACLYSIV